ncbi:MAG: DNA recombination protein RmuC [Prevotella sp.]|nr:DNA recombination protein RmuC [Prevotella sp.]
MAVLGYFIGNHGKKAYIETIGKLENNIAELGSKVTGQESVITEKVNYITTLTAERDVQKTNADNYSHQLDTQKDNYEKQIISIKTEATETLLKETERSKQQLSEQRSSYEKQMNDQKTSYENQINSQKSTFEKQIQELKESFAKQLNDFKAESEKSLKKQEDAAAEFIKTETQRNTAAIEEMKRAYEQQIADLKSSFEQQLKQTREAHESQITTLKQMNEKQVKSQLDLIKEQMQTTSEKVLKLRQNELGEQNMEQVSKIVNPLQQSLKEMKEALEKNKEQQTEALTRLDETIKINMEKSTALGETADRLTRALTGKVKAQGNFGELKLKQLLEDLELKEGEQYESQETLKDKFGKNAKGDDGKGFVPDFILHFPNNRHVVVDSKMSLTAYERYMNAEDGTEEKDSFLKAHINSVRDQMKRLAKKEYTKYLPKGYNRLNFAFMYVPIEGALNLALQNDASLWREAYDQGVLILGPQTMYMNLRILEMMWTQVRQLKNQQAMMDAANMVIDRVQDFGLRFMDVESSMNDTLKKITKLKITTADSGASIITAAKNLLKAGASENKKKKSLADLDDSTMFIETDSTTMLPSEPSEKSKDTMTEKSELIIT